MVQCHEREVGAQGVVPRLAQTNKIAAVAATDLQAAPRPDRLEDASKYLHPIVDPPLLRLNGKARTRVSPIPMGASAVLHLVLPRHVWRTAPCRTDCPFWCGRGTQIVTTSPD